MLKLILVKTIDRCEIHLNDFFWSTAGLANVNRTAT